MSESGIFKAAVKLPPSERAAYLNQACGDNHALRRDVESLLRSAESADGFLEASPAAVATIEREARERPGLRVGRYKLLEQIGEGGMGTVWVAEQSEPVKRRVALKLIKPGMDSRQVLSRFEAERQALALMDHPNIAKVYDGGMTDEGRPYFVMEYVKGVPLTDYCDSVRLSIHDRLKLFIPVCQAVQHAHQKGIIHRDLKPSNILICLYDGQPVPKVIDFGLAKAMHQPLTEHTLYTAHGLMVGTPLYMSPEQAEFNNLDVDTRTDIYSLGVILYELLTGTTPLEKKQFKDAAFQEILRLIKDVEPQRPSLKISSLSRVGSAHHRSAAQAQNSGGHSPPYGTSSLEQIAAQRSLDPSQLSRTVRGDLDWIVMKSLEKERSRRYETANGLARDIERFLHDEPVDARPPSSIYRFRKFAQRNKAPVFAGALIALSLLLGITISIWQAIRATAADRLAQNNLGRARQAVQQMLTRVGDERLAFIPQVEEVRLGLLEDALAFYDELLKESDANPRARFEAAGAYLQVSTMESELGRPTAGLKKARRALEIAEGLCKEFPADDDYCAILSDANHAVGIRTAGHSATRAQLAEAEPRYKTAIRLRAELLARHTDDELHQFRKSECHEAFAHALVSQKDRLQDAIEQGKHAIEGFQRLVKRHPEKLDYQAALAHAYQSAWTAYARAQQSLQARETLERSIQLFEPLEAQNLLASPAYNRPLDRRHSFGSYRHDLAWARMRLGEIVTREGDHKRGRALLMTAVSAIEKDCADFPRVKAYRAHVGIVQAAWGNFLVTVREYADAEHAFRRAAECALTPAEKAFDQIMLGWVLTQLDRGSEAEQLHRSIISLASKQSETGSAPIADLLVGIAQFNLGELDRALESLQRSLRTRRGGDSYEFMFLAATHWKKGNQNEALQWYDKGTKWMDNHAILDNPVRDSVRTATEELLRPALAGRGEPN